MSPIDPQSLRDADAGQLVPKGTVCPKCDYPLEGLTRGGVCPECGTPIRIKRKLGVQARDNLTDAPVPWLRRLRLGAIGLAICGGANGVLQAASFFVAEGSGAAKALSLLIFFAGAGWATAVFLCTLPRPFIKGMQINPKDELKTARLVARVTQLGWPIQGLVYFFLAQAASGAAFGGAAFAGEMLLRTAAMIAVLAGVIGFAPLCIWLSHLAHWAQDSGLSTRLRSATVLIGGGGTLLALGLMGSQFFMPLGLIALVALVAYEIGMFLFLLAQFQLAIMAGGAVSNAINTVERDRRVLERKARRVMTGQPREGSLLAEMAAGRGERALDPCPDCGYDLTGLPPTTNCPECGRAPDEASTAYLRVPQRKAHQKDAPIELDAIPLVGDEDEDGPQNPSG